VAFPVLAIAVCVVCVSVCLDKDDDGGVVVAAAKGGWFCFVYCISSLYSSLNQVMMLSVDAEQHVDAVALLCSKPSAHARSSHRETSGLMYPDNLVHVCMCARHMFLSRFTRPYQ
jgi:hypothetical protein